MQAHFKSDVDSLRHPKFAWESMNISCTTRWEFSWGDRNFYRSLSNHQIPAGAMPNRFWMILPTQAMANSHFTLTDASSLQ
jgi:hypothetical protein